jgi:myosin heavy chain 9/10/11/14
LETVRKELADELAKRAHLEQVASTQKAELVGLRDLKVKMKRDLDKALKDLKNKEWECKQLESRQDKTIVEHVHVLEEAKRVTDRQLADAQRELQKNQSYIRSLEKAKSRLAGEAEDLVRETERERVELRAREKSARTQEERASRALIEIERERKARESVEAHNRKLQNELLNSHNLYADLSQQLSLVQQSKDTLEAELARLADETESTSPMAKALFTQSNGVHASPVLGPDALKQIKTLINKHHEELRRLILSDEPRDESFQSRLLQELRLVDEELNASSKRRMSQKESVPEPQMNPVTPKKRRSSSHLQEGQPRTPRPHDKKQVNVLKQHVQNLEVRIAASDRVRKHLEESLLAMTAELEKSDSSNLSLVQYRARLEKEKAHLAKLLGQEKEANRSAEAAQVGDIQAMWAEFQSAIDEERENYIRLEEARKALVQSSLINQTNN